MLRETSTSAGRYGLSLAEKKKMFNVFHGGMNSDGHIKIYACPSQVLPFFFFPFFFFLRRVGVRDAFISESNKLARINGLRVSSAGRRRIGFHV